MLIEKYHGKKVLLRVDSGFVSEMSMFFTFPPSKNSKNTTFYALVADSDEIGVYVENKIFRYGNSEKAKVDHRTQFLIPWNLILSYAVFPDGNMTDDMKDDPTPTLGFQR
jgi:hypothetical protein